MRAAVAGKRVHHGAVAARDQHVGDGLADGLALGDRQHMRLALAAHVGDQGVIVEPCGFLQHRPRHLDRIVKGKLVDDIERCAVETREPLGELGANLDLDLVGEPPDHLAECLISSSL